jgi:hypothetical protein
VAVGGTLVGVGGSGVAVAGALVAVGGGAVAGSRLGEFSGVFSGVFVGRGVAVGGGGGVAVGVGVGVSVEVGGGVKVGRMVASSVTVGGSPYTSRATPGIWFTAHTPPATITSRMASPAARMIQERRVTVIDPFLDMVAFLCVPSPATSRWLRLPAPGLKGHYSMG